METDIFATCHCSNRQRLASTPIDKALRPVSDAAKRLQLLLDVADMLTDKPEITEVDLIALDVLLEAGREHASEIIKRIEQLSSAAGEPEALLPQ